MQNIQNPAWRNLRGVKDPGWQAFLSKSAHLLKEMHSTIMLPAQNSPLK